MRTAAAGVLTPTDIHKIRHYVQHKYGDLPSDRRAEIVADAMQRIVLRQLPAFPHEQKLSVSTELMRSIAVRKQVPVDEKHIFEACLRLDYRDPQLFHALHEWVEQRLGVTIEHEAFKGIIEEGVHIANSPHLQVEAWDAVVGTVAGYYRAPERMAEVIALPGSRDGGLGNKTKPSTYLFLTLALSASTLFYGWWTLHPPTTRAELPQTGHPVDITPPVPQSPTIAIEQKYKNELPSELRYVEVNKERLVQYLARKSSLLAEEPYLSTIVNAAKEHDIHPLLLFAITGQEQAFVPKTHKDAKKIANNPFNVFHSWKEFNTTISESAKIASNTIVHKSQGRPDDVDALTWINTKYAEDVNWSKGVRAILDAMKRQIMLVNER
ncbi:hypothetical protein [Paenibacillus lignilyticus]|uniref:Mannosyl-glycoprotein endo-beta-N-acetylglucosamidase-like domain-containing protein n=1 Tax=Paenibacillus lignilyticus TaxID=1172615 RepID=A0ABS5CBP2_9BACL|nr:hypothetical protein [Paenibacillus lignilyticus]MBP3963363.1 hypothetical protein [Paenibacillus lignilyticus]